MTALLDLLFAPTLDFPFLRAFDRVHFDANRSPRLGRYNSRHERRFVFKAWNSVKLMAF